MWEIHTLLQQLSLGDLLLLGEDRGRLETLTSAKLELASGPWLIAYHLVVFIHLQQFITIVI